jgi:hypothetical protein
MADKRFTDTIEEKLALITPTLNAIEFGGDQPYLCELQTPEKAPTNRWAAFGWNLAEWMLIRALVRSASRELAHTDRLRDSYRRPVVPVDSI